MKETILMTAMRMRSRRVRLLSILFVVLGVLATAGCSNKSKKVNISGKVTCKGEAVGWGNVRFFSSDGTLYSAAPLNPDGTFTATDVPQGEVQVALQQLPIPRGAGQKKGDLANGADEGVSFPSKFVPIPPKYQDPKTANLHYTIGAGDNNLTIELQ